MVLSQSSSSSAYSDTSGEDDNDQSRSELVVPSSSFIAAKVLVVDPLEQQELNRLLSKERNSIIRDQNFRCIIHLDIDYFYAQVEIVNSKLNDGRNLENEPVGIQQNMTISTCNYVAREKYGLHKMMHVNEARKKCPNLVIIPGNMNLYRRVSDSIFSFIACEHFSSEEKKLVTIEQYAMDECYIEVTKLVNGDLLSAIPVSTRLRKAIFKKFGYTTSSGISFNKFISKIACSQTKPNGQSVVATVQAAKRLIRDSSLKQVIPGVGEQTATKVRDTLNVKIINDLCTVSLRELSNVVGEKLANHILQRAQAIDTTPVDDKIWALEGGKSLVNELTFLPVDTMDLVEEKIDNICKLLAERTIEDSTKHSRYPTLITLRYALRDYSSNFVSSSRRHSFCELLRKSSNPSEHMMTSVCNIMKKISLELFQGKIGRESFQLYRLSVQVSDFKSYTANTEKRDDKTSIQSYLVKRDSSSLFNSITPEPKRQKVEQKKSTRTNLLSYFKRVP